MKTASDFAAIFAVLKQLLGKRAKRLAVKTDTPIEYIVLTKSRSPFPQHKGEPLYFGAVRLGKANVSFHLMPLYMSLELVGQVPPVLKKRMQGKTCFNFKALPDAEQLGALERLVDTAFQDWDKKGWLG